MGATHANERCTFPSLWCFSPANIFRSPSSLEERHLGAPSALPTTVSKPGWIVAQQQLGEFPHSLPIWHTHCTLSVFDCSPWQLPLASWPPDMLVEQARPTSVAFICAGAPQFLFQPSTLQEGKSCSGNNALFLYPQGYQSILAATRIQTPCHHSGHCSAMS